MGLWMRLAPADKNKCNKIKSFKIREKKEINTCDLFSNVFILASVKGCVWCMTAVTALCLLAFQRNFVRLFLNKQASQLETVSQSIVHQPLCIFSTYFVHLLIKCFSEVNKIVSQMCEKSVYRCSTCVWLSYYYASVINIWLYN